VPAPRRPLATDLALVLALKCALLAALWFAFVREARVPVDAERTAVALTGARRCAHGPSAAVSRAQTGDRHAQ